MSRDRAIQNWPAAFREQLAKLYEYNRETGYVTRRWDPARGPRQLGSVGSITERMDLLLVVKFEDKAYAIRVARLCVFLETGLLYNKVIHKDGNKLNNKWDNLIPVGLPIDEEGDYFEITEEQRLVNIEEYKMRVEKMVREEKSRRLEMQLETQKSAAEIARAKEAAKLQTTTQREAFVDYQANRDKAFGTSRAPTLLEQHAQEPFVQAVIKAAQQVAEVKAKATMRLGLYTAMPVDQAKLFYAECEKLDGQSGRQFYDLNKQLSEELKNPQTTIEKHILDRYWLARLISYQTPDSQLEIALANYRWLGQPVSKPEFGTKYEEMLTARIRELEIEHNTSEALLQAKYQHLAEEQQARESEEQAG